MSDRQRGLGRGLSALLGEQAADVAVDGSAPAPSGVRMAPIESLKPNPDQPRKIFDREDLEELAASIRKHFPPEVRLVGYCPEHRLPEVDAAIVTRLRAAGAVLLGKTTVGALAYNDIWYGGVTRNPWNLNEGSSGSSAGSASANAVLSATGALGQQSAQLSFNRYPLVALWRYAGQY